MEKENKEKSIHRIRFNALIGYLSKTTSGMALGLFATLIIGVIISQFGVLVNYTPLIQLGEVVKGLMGAGIGIGVALSLKKLSPLEIISAGAVGLISCAIKWSPETQFTLSILFKEGNGNPLMGYVVTICAIELSKLILFKKTPVDIILVPLVYIAIGGLFAFGLIIPIDFIIVKLGEFIHTATTYQPFLMGIVISLIMGMCLTAPISSVAIAVAINLSGIAAGAACVGCCVQMIGFAAMTARDNNIGKVISVGIGTSMLQFGNIIKKPIIWLPTMIISMIVGPMATCLFQLNCNPIGAGMGTCALIGPIQLVLGTSNVLNAWLGMILLCFVIPIVGVFLLDLLFRKLNWIKKGDLTI